MARRAKPAIDQSNLRMNHGAWQIRYKLPEHLGAKRLEISTGTADLSVAAAMRDRILTPLRSHGATIEVVNAVLLQAHQNNQAGRQLIERVKEDLKISLPTGPEISKAGKRFIENRRNFKLRSGHTIYDYTRTLEVFEAVVGDIPIVQITRQHIRDFRDKLLVLGRYWRRGQKLSLLPAPEADRISSKTVHKMVKNISTFLNWCVQEDLVSKNAAVGVDLPTVQRNATQPPPPELADALCSLPPLVRASKIGILEWEVLPWFYRYTGARCGEIAQLRMKDVTMIDGVRCLMIMTEKTAMRSTKNQGEIYRPTPVHARLIPYLDRVLAARAKAGPEEPLFAHAGHYFVKSVGDIRYGHGFASHYNDHAKKVWPNMHVHCWRSYAITEMGRRGIPEEVRRKLVGHVPRDVHAGYNHVDLTRLVEAVNAIP